MPPWEGINFSNCHPRNKTPVSKAAPAVELPRKPTHSLSGQRISAFLPLCSTKPVPTPQMRQSKVWEHSPKIGVRHIHSFLSSIHCGFKAIRPKRGGEVKKKKKKDPNYLLTPSRGNVLQTVVSRTTWSTSEKYPSQLFINTQPISPRFKQLISSWVCPLLGSLSQL